MIRDHRCIKLVLQLKISFSYYVPLWRKTSMFAVREVHPHAVVLVTTKVSNFRLLRGHAGLPAGYPAIPPGNPKPG